MTADLFPDTESAREALAAGAVVLRGYAVRDEPQLFSALHEVVGSAPFRRMVTPGGFTMSVAMTNCGALGWVTDRSGYRYDAIDPDSGLPWPSMPEVFRHLATNAATSAGFDGFEPDACLINCYEIGSRLSLHQDRNERDLSAPVVSVSLGLPAVFQFGGLQRQDKPARVALAHGDVVVWGGPSRLRYHGVLPLRAGLHPVAGAHRYNLTFRRAA